MQKLRLHGGQILLEVVVAIGVATIGLIGIVSLIVTVQRNTNFSKSSTSATRLAQELTEWFRGQKDASWQQFYTNTATSPQCFQTLEWSGLASGCLPAQVVTDTNFKREATFVRPPANPNLVSVTITVTWADGQGTHDVTNYTTFTNWAGN